MMSSWERGEEEPALAYNAFWIYASFGETRDLSGVVEKTKNSLSQIKVWADKHNWFERAEQYDTYMHGRLLEFDRGKFFLRQRQIIEESYDDYERLLEEWRGVLDIQGENLTPTGLSKMINSRIAIDTIGRKAAMLPDSYKPQEIKVLSTDKDVQLEWNDPKMISGKIKSK